MKTISLALVGMVTAAFAGEASAHGDSGCGRQHVGVCIKLFETARWEKRDVTRVEQVLVGYRDEIVGYQDVWVERPVTVYETRSVFAGYDRHRRPIYRCQQVPVCRTQRVCEKRPIYEKRPVYEGRTVTDCQWVKVPQPVYVCVR